MLISEMVKARLCCCEVVRDVGVELVKHGCIIGSQRGLDCSKRRHGVSAWLCCMRRRRWGLRRAAAVDLQLWIAGMVVVCRNSAKASALHGYEQKKSRGTGQSDRQYCGLGILQF